MRPELILNIEKFAESQYFWILTHEDGIQSIGQGVKPSIAGALKAAFSHVPVGENVDVGLAMTPSENFEYYTADMPRRRSGGGIMRKDSESPDFEKGARFLLANLR